ncbi:MAG TPA: serine/threonine-protein kinase, partial [Gemmataceae bacterium]
MYLPSTAPELIDLLAESGILAPQYLEQIRSQVPPPGTPGHEPKEFLATLVRQQILTPYQAKRLLAGQTGGYFIGRYRILELIGAGGMGKVYLAEQVTMKRPVALKLLPSKGSAHASGLARFMREARAVAKLRHTNIATAYDFDQEGDIYYIAMEYVEGLDVQELVKKIGPIPWPQACHLICQAANGLDHARQNGLVHRDIKPGNLMVEPTGILKILDLGLVVFHAEKDSLTLADKDVILGTADYIAPEQAIDSHDVDTRADIYSLGGVLYYMLTGQPPFPDKSVTQKLLLHQMKDPRPVKELAPDVPDEVAAVLQKMMAKQREDRFQKPRDVREALLRFAKQAKLFDSSLVRFPRETIEQYIR